MTDLVLVVCAGLAVLVGSTAWVLAARGRTAARRDVAAARAESAELRARLEDLERRGAALEVASSESAADPAPVEVSATTVPAPVFTDMVVRESVIRLASLTHGVRRALAPAQRNRIRFEVRAAAKRSRKRRRSDLKAALRQMQAQEREAA